MENGICFFKTYKKLGRALLYQSFNLYSHFSEKIQEYSFIFPFPDSSFQLLPRFYLPKN